MNIKEWSDEFRKRMQGIAIGKIRHDPAHQTIRLHIPPYRFVLSERVTPAEAADYVRARIDKPLPLN